jgi:hypothetical protein
VKGRASEKRRKEQAAGDRREAEYAHRHGIFSFPWRAHEPLGLKNISTGGGATVVPVAGASGCTGACVTAGAAGASLLDVLFGFAGCVVCGLAIACGELVAVVVAAAEAVLAGAEPTDAGDNDVDAEELSGAAVLCALATLAVLAVLAPLCVPAWLPVCSSPLGTAIPAPSL